MNPPITVAQLTERLYAAADMLRGDLDVSQYFDAISGLLILKWADDRPGTIEVPEDARWQRLTKSGRSSLGQALNEALRSLERSNPDVLEGALDAFDFSRLRPDLLTVLMDHIDQISLRADDLEFDDVVGRVYEEMLDRLAHQEGKRGGEFYTPRSVVRLMVDLVRPEPGQSVYDPCAGSGGMLVQAMEYVYEHYGQDASLSLHGQEKNSSAWSSARLNLLLHGIGGGSILRGDTLAEPRHVGPDGRLMLFDRVLTNPPFSMKYSEKGMKYPERMRYGRLPGNGRRADLMNVQHVLAVLRPDGIGAVVTPHGVLFRSGAEAVIRREIIEDGRIEAVIGIGPNVFLGTAIPACVLVVRGSDGPPEGRTGRILFINAEHEVVTGRTQNYLAPQHVDKIVRTFHSGDEVPGFSRFISIDEIARNDYNLNIRRYVGAASPSEPPLDVRAALFGGIPRREVEARAPMFEVFGIDPTALFFPRNDGYLYFLPEGYEATASRIRKLAAPRERKLLKCHDVWWKEAGARIAELAGTGRLLLARSELMASFERQLLQCQILTNYQLSGVFAAWWFDHHDDLKSLNQRGFPGVMERWGMGTEQYAQDRVLDRLGDALRARVGALATAERQMLTTTYQTWGERYATSLADLDKRREVTAARLRARLGDLGYA
jgi:type I restriction enzyme M protein